MTDLFRPVQNTRNAHIALSFLVNHKGKEDACKAFNRNVSKE